MLYLIGDIHGDFFILKALLEKVPKEATIVQVGDFGIWPQYAPRWKRAGINRDIHFIDGNHDYIPWLDADSPSPVEIWPHAIYIPRGHVANFDVNGSTKRFLFLGGSKSVDRAWRIEGNMDHGWFESEQLNEAQIQRALNAGQAEAVDYMITHTPPKSFIEKTLGLDGLRAFGHNPAKWTDESAEGVERIWKGLSQPQLYCGHIHKAAVGPKIRSLDINEIIKVGE